MSNVVFMGNIKKLVYFIGLWFEPRLLHQSPSNTDYIGLTNTLQCNYNVNINQDLSNQIIKKNDNSLLNIKRYLKKYDLLNNKNLTKRKDIYYFTFYLSKDKIFLIL